MRLLFAASLAVCLIFVSALVLWMVRRDTPARAVRRTVRQLSSMDEEAILRLLSPERTADSTQDYTAQARALGCFFDQSSCRILRSDRDKDRAQVTVQISAPDARSLASDIRLDMIRTRILTDSVPPDQTYDAMARLLEENTYPQTDTEGVLVLEKQNGVWNLVPDSSLPSLLLGGLPEALQDPYLVTPSEVAGTWLEQIVSMSAEEWASIFQISDLFSTYAENASEIDLEFLTRAKDAFSYGEIREETDASSSEVHVSVTGIDTAAILGSYREKLISYGETIDAITDDSVTLSAKSAQLLLDSIKEADSTRTCDAVIYMENDGSGWVITDASRFTDALFGGMDEAVSEVFGSAQADE